MYLKLFVSIVLLGGAFCQHSNSDQVISYELPDGDTKSLNVTIDSSSYYQFEIKFKCYNYDSLKFFEVRLDDSKEFALRNGLTLDFIKCFNNATDNENYNYGLNRWFNSLPHFKTAYAIGYPLTIQLDEYAEVNSDVLFENFDFGKFNTLTFKNVGLVSSKFLNRLHCQNCIFENNGRIDFNEMPNNNTVTQWFQTSFNKLINFKPENLKKFVALLTLTINDFDLDDYNALNVPRLFEHNVNTTEIKFENSKGKIILHEDVFRGLKSIQRILLQGLQLDNIPKDLFKDLPELNTVYLSSNNIKAVDPSIFQTNKKFSFVSFTDNPFYTEPHDKLGSFDMGGESTRLELGNFTAHTFDLMEQLIKFPNLTSVTFQSFLIENFNFEDFTKIQSNRTTVLDTTIQGGKPALDLDYIKSLGNIIQPEFEINNQLNTLIRVEFAGDAMCHDCTMIKYLFPHYLKRYYDRPGFYFNESRLFVEFTVPDSCNRLEEKFDQTFVENCPEICGCKFNSLTLKVKINCNNKNLTEIPHIPYPKQYDNLRAIDLHFKNNSLSVLTSANQDTNVWKKLATLNLQNNKIETLPTEPADLLINIWTFNICGNPVVGNDTQYVQPTLASGVKYMSTYYCNVDDEQQQVVNYLQEKESSELDEHLNGLKC